MCYDNIVSKSHVSIPLLMGIVHEAITCMDKRDVTSYQEQLFKFFLVVLDFRVVQPQVTHPHKKNATRIAVAKLY